jgi:phosphoribosylanthranilate isomerase
MAIVRVKMCGMTQVKDALFAAKIGVNALGLIFYEPSPRAVSITQAKTIIDALPPFITTVGLFVNPDPKNVQALLKELPLDLLQFHGNEPAADCRCYGKPYIKAIPMRDQLDWPALLQEYSDAKGLLLDTYHNEMPGGTGQVFDWQQIPPEITKPIILAGGLTPDNVAQAVHQVHPYAVDVTSGVEKSKGHKDHSKMQRFMQAIQSTQR